MPNISKRPFLTSLTCQTAAWYDLREPQDALSLSERYNMEMGSEVGQRARLLYPDGTLVDSIKADEAVIETTKLLLDPTINAIFEAAFIHRSFRTRADILVRAPNDSWKLVEVKSGLFKPDEIEKDHINDLAYTAFVLSACGIKIHSTSLLRIDPDYRRGMGVEKLFRESDCSKEVFERVDSFRKLSPEIEQALQSDVTPEPTVKSQCKKCAHVTERCVGKGIENPIYEIPRIETKKLQGLFAASGMKIEDIPADFELTKIQRKMVKTVQSNVVETDDEGLKTFLSSILWPVTYLDFETTSTPLPFWDDIPPWTKIVTQFSVHISDAPGHVIAHHEYLADPDYDSRRELTQSLLDALGSEGSIIVYSSYEKTQLTSLGVLFPEYAHRLQSCIDRIVDLEKIFNNFYTHPAFRGRTSIKVTLPVLVPSMSYEGLAVSDGLMAQTMFAMMASGRIVGEERKQVRADLLEYCCQDTLAMVRLHDFFTLSK